MNDDELEQEMDQLITLPTAPPKPDPNAFDRAVRQSTTVHKTPTQEALPSLSAATLALVDALPNVLEAIEGIEGAKVEDVEELHAHMCHQQLLQLDKGVKIELVHYLVAVVRDMQQQLDAHTSKSIIEEVTQKNLSRAMRRIKEFYDVQHLGFIHGLQAHTYPKYGHTWGDERHYWHYQLTQHITPPTYDVPVVEEFPAQVVRGMARLENKRVLVAMGTSLDPDQRKRFIKASRAKEMTWHREHESSRVKDMKRLMDRIRAGDFDVVIACTSQMNHDTYPKLYKASTTAPQTILCVEVAKGVGLKSISKVLDHLDAKEAS